MYKIQGFVISSFFFLIILTNPILAQEDKTPEAEAEKFLEQIIEGNIDQAFDGAFTQEMQTLMGTGFVSAKSQLPAYLNMMGAVQGVELIRTEKFSDRVVRLIYFVYTETVPMTFNFYFYENEGNWRIVNFAFDSDFDELARKN